MTEVDPSPPRSVPYVVPPAPRRRRLTTSVVLLWSGALVLLVMAIAAHVVAGSRGAGIVLYAGAGAAGLSAALVSFFYSGIDRSTSPPSDDPS